MTSRILSTVTARLTVSLALGFAAAALTACGSSTHVVTVTSTGSTTTTTAPTLLPGTGKPQVTIGDKNYTEQFVLGELYYEALQAQGFPVLLNRNIGPTAVTLQAIKSGQLALYPEYLNVWNTQVARNLRRFTTRHGAYVAGRRYALEHGMDLLDPTPFSDTNALGVTLIFSQRNRLRTIGDLRRVARGLTLGVPPQFEQDPSGLPALERAYRFKPGAVKALEIGNQYQALDQGAVQAAGVTTTDGELTSGNYAVLEDPRRVLGIGNVVPVVSSQVLSVEGEAFANTINRVTGLLTLPVIRQLNAQVDLAGRDPATVAKRFLVDHGVIPAPTSSS